MEPLKNICDHMDMNTLLSYTRMKAHTRNMDGFPNLVVFILSRQHVDELHVNNCLLNINKRPIDLMAPPFTVCPKNGTLKSVIYLSNQEIQQHQIYF